MSDKSLKSVLQVSNKVEGYKNSTMSKSVGCDEKPIFVVIPSSFNVTIFAFIAEISLQGDFDEMSTKLVYA